MSTGITLPVHQQHAASGLGAHNIKVNAVIGGATHTPLPLDRFPDIRGVVAKLTVLPLRVSSWP